MSTIQAKLGQKTALVLGGAGLIGHNMIKRLQNEDFWVRGVDIRSPEYETSSADEFKLFDLRNRYGLNQIMTTPSGQTFDHIYQFAADMGGADYIFTGEHDADVMHSSACINLNVLDVLRSLNKVHSVNKTRIFYSSSACIYPRHNQLDPLNPKCSEESAYPADPDSDYGWEKLFSERLYAAFGRNYKIPVRVARYHNVFGPHGAWEGDRAKAPAALCRKVANATDDGEIEIYGDGEQTRSFLYVDECLEATRRFMDSDFEGPVNIGSEEMVSINKFVEMISKVANKKIRIKHISGPLGVRGRNSDNALYREKIGWVVSDSLEKGIEKTYAWVNEQVRLSQLKK